MTAPKSKNFNSRGRGIFDFMKNQVVELAGMFFARRLMPGTGIQRKEKTRLCADLKSIARLPFKALTAGDNG